MQHSFLVLCGLAGSLAAQGNVLVVSPTAVGRTGQASLHRLSTAGTFTQSERLDSGSPALAVDDEFGRALVEIGDLDGDGGLDFAVGLPGLDAPIDNGAVRVFRFDAAGAPQGEEQIDRFDVASLTGKWTFGKALAPVGDFDGDGVPDLAVGGPGLVLSGTRPATPGMIWLLGLTPSGGIHSELRIGNAQAGFTGTLNNYDNFGSSLTSLGDLDGDGVTDLAVGAQGDDDGFADAGAVWILFLNADGTVRAHQKISATSGGFGGSLAAFVRFGAALANLGDLDGDGVTDLGVGAPSDNDGGAAKGALWVLRLNSDGTVKASQKISATSGGFPGALPGAAQFGSSCARLGDLDGDGRPEIGVGAPGDWFAGAAGFVWLLSLEPTGLVHAAHAETSFGPGTSFGSAVARASDRNGDGLPELLAGGSTMHPPGRYTTIAAALAEAQDGDTLLVQGGNYASVTLSRPMTILADSGASVVVGGALRVENLASGAVVVRGLTIEGGASLVNNGGSVWLEDSILRANPESDLRVLDVDACSDVVLLGVEVQGRSDDSFAHYDSSEGQTGMRVRGASSVQAFDCAFEGGDGAQFDCPGSMICGQIGGVGLRSEPGSFVFLSGSTAVGGNGSVWVDGFPIGCDPGGVGLESAGEGLVLDCELVGGEPGAFGSAPCGPQSPGSSGSVTLLPGQALALGSTAPVRDDVVTLDFQGTPYTPVYLSASPSPLAQWLPSVSRVLLTGTPRERTFVGVTDGAGHLSASFPLAPLAPGEVVRRLFLQASHVTLVPGPALPAGKLRSASARFELGGGSVLVQLAPGS